MKKIITIALSLLTGTVVTSAQNRSEISISGGSGFAPLYYQPSAGKHSCGFGGQFGVGFHVPLSEKWSLGTGVELAFYNSEFKMDNLYTRHPATDMDGATFELRSRLDGYKEKQRATLLQIPLMVQFQTSARRSQTGGKRAFYAAVGGKAGIPLQGKYTNSAKTIRNTGYYSAEASEYDTQTFMGFGAFTDRTANGNLNFDVALLASAEAGVKWRLGNRVSLYTGAYVDYGLNNVRTQSGASLPPVVEYNPADPPAFAMNSVIKAQYAQGAAQAFTDKVRPVAAGIKIRLTFGMSRAQPQPPAPQDVPPIPQRGDQKEALDSPPRSLPRHVGGDEEAAAAAAAEEEARRLAAERAQQEEAARMAAAREAAKEQIRQSPVSGYRLNQREPDDAQKQRLDNIIALLQQYPDMQIQINSHTCERGTVAANNKVGLERAQKVKDYLLSHGIDASRVLGLESMRDAEPLVPNTGETNRRANRRVEVVVRE